MLEDKQADNSHVSELTSKAQHDVLAALDNSSLTGFHFKAMITSGMGFFTDAYDLTTITAAFLLVYGMSYFFTEFGPNVTTFVYPAEIFPVMVRSTAHGTPRVLVRLALLLAHLPFLFC